MTGADGHGPGAPGRGLARPGQTGGGEAQRRRSEALASSLAPGAPAAGRHHSALVAALRRGREAGSAVAVPPLPADPRLARAEAALAAPRRPRMVFAIDATASRGHAWEAARAVTDSMFREVPGGLDIALAVHSGGRMTHFSAFHDRAGALRDDAASATCKAGHTRLLDILERARGHAGVKAIVYIGDNYEEDAAAGLAAADGLRARGTRLIVLHDAASARPGSLEAFQAMAVRTGGCVLPFDAGAPQRLRDVLASVAAYAAGGRDLLRRRSLQSPAARLLLEHLAT